MIRRLGIVALALLLSACRGDHPGEPLPGRVDIAVTPTPPIVGPNRIIIEIRDSDSQPVEGARVRLEGTMEHAGMVPVRESASEEGNGRYGIPSFDFTMAGDWILRADITLPDGAGGVHRSKVRVAGRPEADALAR